MKMILKLITRETYNNTAFNNFNIIYENFKNTSGTSTIGYPGPQARFIFEYCFEK